MLKLLLNYSEAHTDESLRAVCDAYGARVFPKVRVADVLPIEHSGISDDLYRYALQGHFDFVAAEQSSVTVHGVGGTERKKTCVESKIKLMSLKSSR
jgi:hypothetical protein